MNTRIYIICGPNGSGKSIVVEYLREKYDAKVFRPSDIARTFLEEFDIPVTRTHLSRMMWLLRRELTSTVFIPPALQFLSENRDAICIFDGIRKVHFIEAIKKEWATIISIESHPDIRYARIQNRGEKEDEDDMSYDDFLRDESLESESDMWAIRDMADIIVDNSGTKEELYRVLNHSLL